MWEAPNNRRVNVYHVTILENLTVLSLETLAVSMVSLLSIRLFVYTIPLPVRLIPIPSTTTLSLTLSHGKHWTAKEII